MILSDETLARYLRAGKIQILPAVRPSDIRPTGIRVHLDDKLLVPVAGQVVDLGGTSDISDNYQTAHIGQEGYLLHQDDFVLASTAETILTDRTLICHVEGRSTLARLGLMIHCSSSIADNMHDEPRAITLELKNIGKFHLLLRRTMPIAMLVFSELSTAIRQDSQPQYRGQSKVTPPNLSFRPE